MEVYDTKRWGTEYISPVGENSTAMYEDTRMIIMAGFDATTVQIDLDGDGVAEQTILLNEGESYVVERRSGRYPYHGRRKNPGQPDCQ